MLVIGDRLRLFDLLDYQLRTFPKSDLFTAKRNGNWKKQSTAEVNEAVNRLSAGLLALGIGGKHLPTEEQDKVALIAANCPEWLILDLACQQIGVILCPVYPTTNAAELEFIFNDAAVKYVFTLGADITQKVLSIRDKVPSLRDVFSLRADAGVRLMSELSQNISQDQLKNAAEAKAAISDEQCATIIYTSGTTGTPKGVMLSHRNIVSNVINSKTSFPFDDDAGGRALSFLPLNHIFERVASYIFIASGHSIWFAESMETIGENLKEVKPTVFCTVPRLLEKVYEKIMAKGAEQKGIKRKLFYRAVELANRYDNLNRGSLAYRMELALMNKLVFSKWREALGNNLSYVVTGGAACQVRLLRIFNAAGIPLYEGYGPTENSPVISVNRRGPRGMKFGTVGPVLDGQEVKLEADGEICVKGPSVMMGYYKQPELDAETLINGWLHTGDIGLFEDGQYLKITDRKKELFKTSGGKYVAPQPIENKLKESPFIEQVMVIGAEEKFTGALIVPAMPALTGWARAQQLSISDTRELLKRPEVQLLFREIINGNNQQFNHVEQIKKFELLHDEWTIPGGELTPTLKLRRKIIMEKYGEEIAKIYRKGMNEE